MGWGLGVEEEAEGVGVGPVEVGVVKGRVGERVGVEEGEGAWAEEVKRELQHISSRST